MACIKYKFVDGWHVFYSDEMPGLYVASRDFTVAQGDVTRSIDMLIQLDIGAR